MGLRAAELEVLFTADASQVEKADKDIKSIGERIEKKPIKVDADPKKALASMDRVESAAKKLVSADTAIKLDADISRAEKSLDRAKQRLQDLEVRALGGLDVTADVRRAEAALQKTERQLKALTDAKQMIEVDANTTPSENAFRRARTVAEDSGEDAGDAFGSSILGALASIPIVGAVTAIGVGAAQGLIDSFNDGLRQQADRDRLQGLTGISEDAAARLGRAAGEAYANVFGESVESNMDIARLGVQFDLIDPDAAAASSQRVIQSLAGIADALGEDVRPVAAAVATLLRTGVVRSADEAFDVIAAGAREGVNRNEDMLDTLTEYPALFARLGLSGEEALGLINQGLDAGARNSDLAADALKEFQIRATDASTLSAEGFRLLGLNAEEMTAKIARGGEDAREGLDIVLDRLREMEDPVARNTAAVALFGTQAEDLGAALFAMDLSSAVDELNGVQGAAQRMFDTLASNDATAVEQAQRNIEVAADGIRGALAAAFSEPLGDFAEWVSQNRGPLTEFLLGLANGALDFGRSMVIAASDGTVALGEFVAGPLRDTVVGLRDFLEWLPGDQDLSGLDSLIAGMDGFDESTADAAQTMRDTLIPGIDDAQARMNEWAAPVVQLGYLNDATLALASSIDAVGFASDGTTPMVDGFRVATDGSVRATSALDSQLRSAIGAMNEEIAAASRTGESQDELRRRFDNATGGLVHQLTQMGMTEDQARDLIRTYGAVPDSINTTVTASTSQADREIGSYVRRWDGHRIRTFVDTYGGTSYQVPGSNVRFNAQGNLLEFMAHGGLTPMASVATVVPPNTWRVVGDRMDVSELYAPLDGSARSWALILEGIRRMGGRPMAEGGVTSPAGVGRGEFARPIYTDSGVLFGWLQEIAGREARLVLNEAAFRVGAGVKGRYA